MQNSKSRVKLRLKAEFYSGINYFFVIILRADYFLSKL